jgi:PAS domain S-box-containing protein
MEPDIDRFYRTLVRDTADAIIYADAEGLIGFWNAGAERIFGFSAAEAIGEPLDIIIPATLRERHWSGYRETVRSGKSRYGAGDVLAVPALRKDGTRKAVRRDKGLAGGGSREALARWSSDRSAREIRGMKFAEDLQRGAIQYGYLGPGHGYQSIPLQLSQHAVDVRRAQADDVADAFLRQRHDEAVL